MKVAVTHPYSWPEVRRGAERILVETAAALARRGHDVTAITSGREPGRTNEAGGFSIVRFRRKHVDAQRHERWFARRLVTYLAKGRFDVVHSLMPRDALAAIRSRRIGGHRVVYEEMGNPARAWWSQRPDERVRLEVVRGADAYGCMSQYALDVLKRDHGIDGVLIPGGVSLDEFAPATARTDDPTVLFSGKVDDPGKGVALLLDAAAIVRARLPRFQVWLSGPGDADALVAAAPAAAQECTSVLPLGDPHEQAERYARAWATALPSKGDSFGMVLLESLACGTPIVALDDSATPELVSPGTGAVAAPDDPVALARAVEEVVELARDRDTVTRCRARAADYTWDALAARLEPIYEG